MADCTFYYSGDNTHKKPSYVEFTHCDNGAFYDVYIADELVGIFTNSNDAHDLAQDGFDEFAPGFIEWHGKSGIESGVLISPDIRQKLPLTISFLMKAQKAKAATDARVNEWLKANQIGGF